MLDASGYFSVMNIRILPLLTLPNRIWTFIVNIILLGGNILENGPIGEFAQ